jgi:hypothetical protein
MKLRHAVGDVVRHGVVEQKCLLRHDAEEAAKARQVHVTGVDAVDGDGAA